MKMKAHPSTGNHPGHRTLLPWLHAWRSRADPVLCGARPADLDLAGLGDAETLLGALCIGGADFALWLARQAEPIRDDEACAVAVVNALTGALDIAAAAGVDEPHLGLRLVDDWALDVAPESLIDVLRTELLVRLGPASDLPAAVMAAMRHQRWDLAFDGVARVRESLGSGTPRDTYGLGAVCLHRLGRYDEAQRWIDEGLGDDRRRLAVPPARTEEELLARWGGAERPVVSILCTAFNHQRYIPQTLQGFLSQDCPFPFEILVHDDASTDRTQDVIREWQSRYPRIIKPLLQTENQYSRGVRPLELLLARAQGDYVATCEGDDYWIAPSKLHRQVGYLMAHPEVSCSAHNYYLFVEASLAVRPWSRIGRDFLVSQRQMMAAQFLLWMPTLVFRRTFSALPPERGLAAFGDQFLTSYLGTLGRCVYFETLTGAVRRENEFSSWTPLPAREKERRRVRTWTAMLRMHERLGNQQAVDDLAAKIAASTLDAASKAEIDVSCPPIRSALPEPI